MLGVVGVSLALPRCYGVRLKSKLSAWASKGVVYASWRMRRAPYNRYCVKSRAAGGTSEERMGNQEECPPNLGLMREGNGEEGGKQRRERGEGEGGGNSWAHGGSRIPDHGDTTRFCLFSRPTPRISRRWSRAPPLTNVLCPLGWSTALCGPPLWSPLVHDCNTACNSFSSLSFPMICCSARASLPSTLLHVLALLYHL